MKVRIKTVNYLQIPIGTELDLELCTDVGANAFDDDDFVYFLPLHNTEVIEDDNSTD